MLWPDASRKSSTTLQNNQRTLQRQRGACRQKTQRFGDLNTCPLHLSAWRYSPTASSRTFSACSGGAMDTGLCLPRTEQSDSEARVCSSGELPQPKRNNMQRAKGCHSGSHEIPHLLPNVQAQRLWTQASWVTERTQVAENMASSSPCSHHQTYDRTSQNIA